MPANVIHVVAMAAWLGGIAVLVFALRAATAGVAPEQRTPLLGTVVGRFSTLAGPALAVLILTGVVQSLIEVGSSGALLDTPFGRSVLIKIAVAIVIVALGALQPAEARAGAQAPDRLTRPDRRAAAAHPRCGTRARPIALGVTGALSSYAPSTAQASGKPFSTTVNVGPARVEVTVDPAQVGPNEMHVYLVRPQDRRAVRGYRGASSHRRDAIQKIAKIDLEPNVAGPGHYVVNAATLGVAGDGRSRDRARLGLQRVRAGLHRPDQG